MEDLDVDEVAEWILEEGFPATVAGAFSDEQMDGTAIVQAFGSCPGPDCIKEVVPKPFGMRLKVYTAIKTRLEKENKEKLYSAESPASDGRFKGKSDQTQIQDSSSDCTDMQSLTSSQGCSPVTVRRQKCSGMIPNPFPVPMFRETTEDNLSKCKVGEDDRKYMVRVLATLLSTYVRHPSMRDCGVVAESLLRKFSFLKESNSWRQYIYVRCQNINRKYSRATPEPKRQKAAPCVAHSYVEISINQDDQVAHERNTDHLKKEIEKPKHKVDVIKELIRRTLKNRRDMVLSGDVRPAELLLYFPHLKKANYIFYEFELISGNEFSFDAIMEVWSRWKSAILDYATSSGIKSKLLEHALRDHHSDSTEAESLTALRCLAYWLVPKKRKAGGQESTSTVDIPHLLMEGKRGTPPSELVCRFTNQPHLVKLVDEDLPSQYYIAVEQSIQLEVASVMKGVLLLLSLHYVYDIKYNERIKDLYKYFECKLLNMTSSSKDTANFSSITNAIESYIIQD